MSNRKFFLALFLLAFSVILVSCRPHRVIIPTVEDLLRAPDRAIRAVHRHHADFNTFSARFSGNASWAGNQHPVSGTIRIQKDKAIWVSVAPFLGIEVSRILITPDSLKFLNRLEASYFVGDINSLHAVLGSGLDFFMIQDFFMGNDFKHFNTDNFTILDDRQMILLRTENRMKNNDTTGHRVAHSMWVDPADFRIRRLEMFSQASQQKISISYNQFLNIENQLLPSEIAITFSAPGNQADFSLRFSRITLNAPQEFSFSVPARYNHIEL